MLKQKLRQVCHFFASHISASLICSGAGMLFLTMVIFQSYLKNEYYQYLLSTTTQTERAVLEVSALNLEGTLRELLHYGAGIATNRTLDDLASRMLSDDRSTVGNRLLLQTELSSITRYNDNLAATTIVSEDGILMEYERYWGDSAYKRLWQQEEAAIMEGLYQAVTEQIKDPAPPLYQVEQASFVRRIDPAAQMFHLAFPLTSDLFHIHDTKTVMVFTVRLDTLVTNGIQTDDEQRGKVVASITAADGSLVFQEGGPEDAGGGSDAGLQRISRHLNYFDWTLHLDIDTEQIQRHVDQLYLRGMLVYGGLLLLCTVLWQLAIRHVLKPVGTIRGAMQRIGDGELDAKIEINGEHELWQLAGQYNRMVDALEQQRTETQREFQEKTISIQRQGEAERQALESQINAHFLFNTLGAINYHAIETGNSSVADLLKKLSNILYYSFSKKMKTVTLGEEISWVEQYLYLQKFRLMDVFDYEIRFQEAYGEWPCCKLFLQPFVENSILHGFEGWERGGLIQIIGRAKGSRFCIQVRDNGLGMGPETAQIIRGVLDQGQGLSLEDTNQVGIGIQNAVTRLRMYYGPELSLQLETAPGQGTCFTFLLPLPPEPQEVSEEAEKGL